MRPQIYVLSRPSFTDDFARFLRSEQQSWVQTQSTPAEKLIEFAGRICYMSFGQNQSSKTNLEYILNLITQGHESVLEHVCWTFLLTGITRALPHQLVRHRPGFAFSQLSQQYHDETAATFIAPESLETAPQALAAWTESIESARRAYQLIVSQMLAKGNASKEAMRSIRSAARSVLPNATETKIVVTANARAIRHLFNVRGSIEGDLEMRRVCSIIYGAVVPDAPHVFADFKLTANADETPNVVKM
jgi:thymidylate synthase (FAD)